MIAKAMRIRAAALAAFASCAFALCGSAADASGGAKIKVACIGDSITYGLGLEPAREEKCYPARLQKLLDESAPGGYEVRNFGNSGRGVYLDSMRGNEKRGFRWMPEHKAAVEWKPDVVVSNLGINDCGEYLKEYTGEREKGRFAADYVALLEDYKAANPSVRLFVWTKLAPLAPGQKFYRSPEPFLMQKDLEAVCRATGAAGIDMQEPLTAKMDEIFARDKIHPGAGGAGIVAGTVFKALRAHRAPRAAPQCPCVRADCETWLCAGQSNMQKGWGEFNRTAEEKERVEGEMERLAKTEIWFWDFNDGRWTRLTPRNASRKCAFGVSFAIRRAEATGKAVKMLYVAAGGAPTESFLAESTMCAVDGKGAFVYPRLAAIATNRHRLDMNADFPCKWVAREYPRRRNNMDEGRWWPVSSMFDNGIAKIRQAGLDADLTGILWYQGESNATTCVAPDEPTDKDYQLETLRAVVAELRNGKDVPFLMTGLPAMDRPWERYRESQKQVCAETGAVYIDTFAAGLGDMHDVHPRDKAAFASLAARLADEN